MTTTPTAEAVDVTNVAAERGYRIPVRVARDVFEDAVYWEQDDQDRKPAARYTNAANRLHTLLDTALFPVGTALCTGAPVTFDLFRVPRAGRAWVLRRTRLTAVVDTTSGSPVVTIEAAK